MKQLLFRLADIAHRDGYWSWANGNIGAYGQVVEWVQSAEPNFVNKKPELVWRGKLSIAPKLRRALLDVARGTMLKVAHIQPPWSIGKPADPW
ncbi:hypothetical protein BJX96DRAFT_177722 [Aspergillus floccosus]